MHIVTSFPVSIDSSTESSAALSSTSTHDFFFSPTIDFISDANLDPANVFSQPESPAVEKEPTQTLTVSEGRQLTGSLLESTIKCMQVQNALYRLVLLKLGGRTSGHTTGTSGSENTGAPELLDTPNIESAGENLNDAAKVLLCELEMPLQALMRCAEIQKGLFQRMITVNLAISEDSTDLLATTSSASDNQGNEPPYIASPEF